MSRPAIALGIFLDCSPLCLLTSASQLNLEVTALASLPSSAWRFTVSALVALGLQAGCNTCLPFYIGAADTNWGSLFLCSKRFFHGAISPKPLWFLFSDLVRVGKKNPCALLNISYGRIFTYTAQGLPLHYICKQSVGPQIFWNGE